MKKVPSSPLWNVKNILVATDFSGNSKEALPWAVALARESKAAMTLLHVVPASLPADARHTGLVLEQGQLESEARQAIERFRTAELPSNIQINNLVLAGEPYQEIVRAAKEQGTGLIVLTSHGHTDLKHILIGSTAERVLRLAPCPVFVVRSRVAPRLQRILVPTDFSKRSKASIAIAQDLAQRWQAAIHLLHVIEPPNYPTWGYVNLAMRDKRLAEDAEQQMEAIRQTLPTGAHVDIRSGNAPHSIVEHAAKIDADLILLSTHGHTGLAHFFMGNVAEQVIRHASCPVLVGKWEN